MAHDACRKTYDSLVAALRHRRESLGLSQETVGRIAGVHRNTVRLLEAGRTDATLVTMVRILGALGVTSLQISDGRAELARGDGAAVGVSSDQILQRAARELAARRGQAGISQEALAEKAGLHPNTVGQIERAEEDPTITTVLQLCVALGVQELVVFP